MRVDQCAVSAWLLVMKCWTVGLAHSQIISDDILGEDGSGDLDPVVEVNIEVKPKDTFRDLICFQCSGGECRNHHYKEPLRHMVVSCQACYKEWDHFRRESTRKCFYPSDLTELNHSNISVETSMCGVIERGNRLSYYCFCYLDYCNHGNTLQPNLWTLPFSLLITLTYLSLYSFTRLPPGCGGSAVPGGVNGRRGCQASPIYHGGAS